MSAATISSVSIFELNPDDCYSGADARSVTDDARSSATGSRLTTGALLQLIAYAMISHAAPFPVMCCAFAVIGFGLSIQNAHANGFVASLRQHASTKLGLLHGSYGESASECRLPSYQRSVSSRPGRPYLSARVNTVCEKP